MSLDREYHELYDRLLSEVSALHQSNRRRIRVGMRMLLAVTLGLMVLMFLAEGNKVFTLMLWIISMFAVAAYLIAVEYADYELQKKLEYITQMEQENLGALLELPDLPTLPKMVRLSTLLRRGTSAKEGEQPSLPAAEEAAQTPHEAPHKKAEVKAEGERSEAISEQMLERMLNDPEKLADDLSVLTRALQSLSNDLRQNAKDDGKEDA